MLVKAAENVHVISHLLLLNHEEFPNRVVDSSGYIYGGVDKAGYLRKTSGTNKPSLSFFFFLRITLPSQTLDTCLSHYVLEWK